MASTTSYAGDKAAGSLDHNSGFKKSVKNFQTFVRFLIPISIFGASIYSILGQIADLARRYFGTLDIVIGNCDFAAIGFALTTVALVAYVAVVAFVAIGCAIIARLLFVVACLL
ncbi:hypothetical protein F5Y11DRAFT_362966 [Daldinia sp. FL1419]|nr:hypothetical protein F5Y11DRAFT_362966 [Daldinia sp. FL1419]